MTADPDPLDQLFAEARNQVPQPLDAALSARLIADAARLQPRPAPRGWRHWLAGALAAIGGAPGLASVAAAGVAGLWIGAAAPGLESTALNALVDITPGWASVGVWAAAEDDSLLALMAGTSE